MVVGKGKKLVQFYVGMIVISLLLFVYVTVYCYAVF